MEARRRRARSAHRKPARDPVREVRGNPAQCSRVRRRLTVRHQRRLSSGHHRSPGTMIPESGHHRLYSPPVSPYTPPSFTRTTRGDLKGAESWRVLAYAHVVQRADRCIRACRSNAPNTDRSFRQAPLAITRHGRGRNERQGSACAARDTREIALRHQRSIRSDTQREVDPSRRSPVKHRKGA